MLKTQWSLHPLYFRFHPPFRSCMYLLPTSIHYNSYSKLNNTPGTFCSSFSPSFILHILYVPLQAMFYSLHLLPSTPSFLYPPSFILHPPYYPASVHWLPPSFFLHPFYFLRHPQLLNVHFSFHVPHPSLFHPPPFLFIFHSFFILHPPPII